MLFYLVSLAMAIDIFEIDGPSIRYAVNNCPACWSRDHWFNLVTLFGSPLRIRVTWTDEDVIPWRRFLYYWPFCAGKSPRKWPVIQIFNVLFVFTETSCWTNSRTITDLESNGPHVTSLQWSNSAPAICHQCATRSNRVVLSVIMKVVNTWKTQWKRRNLIFLS